MAAGTGDADGGGSDGHGHDHDHDHAHGGGAEQLAGRSDPPDGPAEMAYRQRHYGQRLRGPLGKINAEMRRAVVTRDVFGYHDPDSRYGSQGGTGSAAITAAQLAPFDPDSLTPDSFDADRPAGRSREFMAWLRRQERAGVLTVISQDDNVYIRRAMADGDRFAVNRLRAAGADVSRSAAYGPEGFALQPGGRAGRLAMSVEAPIQGNTVRQLFERNYSLLDGVTDAMNADIQDELARGLAEGVSPSELSRRLSDRVDSVGKHRATLLARHETMYAHNTAAKARYQSYGVDRVRWLGTDPCPICAPHVDGVYTLGNLPDGGPPLHPNCVGTIAPVI